MSCALSKSITNFKVSAEIESASKVLIFTSVLRTLTRGLFSEIAWG